MNHLFVEYGLRRACLLWLATFATLPACYQPIPRNTPELDKTVFAQEIYPIMMRDCSFPDCHSDRGRFFRVHGPGRDRLTEDTGINAPLLQEEVDAAYERSVSMLSEAEKPERSLLLRKPLEIDQGGAPHKGTDGFNRNVYTRDDEAYQKLVDWAKGVSGEGDGS